MLVADLRPGKHTFVLVPDSSLGQALFTIVK